MIELEAQKNTIASMIAQKEEEEKKENNEKKQRENLDKFNQIYEKYIGEKVAN